MFRSIRLPALLLSLCLWLAACYILRYGLMENARWVGLCAEQASRWGCQARSLLGLMIHFRVIAWTALGLALVAFVLPRRLGWWLGLLALLAGLASLVFYSASLGVFAVVLAGLRLVRKSETSKRALEAGG